MIFQNSVLCVFCDVSICFFQSCTISRCPIQGKNGWSTHWPSQGHCTTNIWWTCNATNLQGPHGAQVAATTMRVPYGRGKGAHPHPHPSLLAVTSWNLISCVVQLLCGRCDICDHFRCRPQDYTNFKNIIYKPWPSELYGTHTAWYMTGVHPRKICLEFMETWRPFVVRCLGINYALDGPQLLHWIVYVVAMCASASVCVWNKEFVIS